QPAEDAELFFFSVPAGPLRALAHLRGLVAPLGGGVLDPEIAGHPGHVDVTVGGDDLVFHRPDLASDRTCTASRRAPPEYTSPRPCYPVSRVERAPGRRGAGPPPAEARRRTMTSSGIGASVKRREDVRLVTGQGRYAEDYDAPGQAYAAFVRSPHAHADVVAIDATPALASGAARVHDGVAGNRAYDWDCGDAEATARALAAAAQVTRLTLVDNRLVTCFLEPRAAVAEWHAATGRYRLHAGLQSVHQLATNLARVLGVRTEQVHCLTEDVGGGFGSKIQLYPEYVALAWAARRLGRPLKWVSSRSEGF